MIRHRAVGAVLLAAACLPTAAQAATTEATEVASIRAVAPPPAGFDAVRASDTDLAAYALPPRPDMLRNPAGYAKWARAMSRASFRGQTHVQLTKIYHGPARNPTQTAARIDAVATGTSSNWSGAVNLNTLTAYNTKKSFYYLLEDYVVPGVTNSTCDGGWDYSSQWAGIDGWNSGDVLQSGTETDAYCSGSTTATNYNAWIEWYPYSESAISGFAISPGNDIFVEVWNTTSTIGYAYMINLSTNQSFEYELTPPSGTVLVGNSAEWIVERPGVDGGLANLADYVLDFHAGAAATNFVGKTFLPGSATSTLVNMLNNSGGAYSNAALLGTDAIEFSFQ